MCDLAVVIIVWYQSPWSKNSSALIKFCYQCQNDLCWGNFDCLRHCADTQGCKPLPVKFISARFDRFAYCENSKSCIDYPSLGQFVYRLNPKPFQLSWARSCVVIIPPFLVQLGIFNQKLIAAPLSPHPYLLAKQNSGWSPRLTHCLWAAFRLSAECT